MDNSSSRRSSSTHSPTKFRFSALPSSRRVPPPRPLFNNATSEHMLPSSNLTPNKSVFSSKHRLVKRNLPFFQSKNKLQVTNKHSELRMFRLLQFDWFHVILRLNLWLSVLLLLGTWTIAIAVWAAIYVAIDTKNLANNCGLGMEGEAISYAPAFAFSLETCTTVGYGLPNGTNAFFEVGCREIIAAIYFQMVWSMMFNAFLFAFFFARIAKSEARGIQVIFSNKAIVSHRPDVPYPCFQFRVFDVDATYPVVEAHVRLYVVTQRSPIPIPLRIVIPNDDLGGMLYLSLPSQVVHAMDAYSPMVPASKVQCDASATVPRDGLHLRQVDSSTNNRDDVCCPVCGESYGTAERLIKHGRYQNMVESKDEYPVKGSHREVDWDEWADLLKKSTTWTIPQLMAFFRSDISEVLCIVEGIDPLASGTFQAIHSYMITDIHFGEAYFADCVCMDRKENLVVDLDFFHRIRQTVPYGHSERSVRELVDGTETNKGKCADRLPQLSLAHLYQQQQAPRSQSNLRNIATPPDIKSPTQQAPPRNHRGSHLDTDHLGYVEPQQHTPQAAPPQSQPLTSQSFDTTTVKTFPMTKPVRRYSSPSDYNYERPPPLFTLDSDLMEGKSTPNLQTTEIAGSRSPLPGNMMNSLATGKFD